MDIFSRSVSRTRAGIDETAFDKFVFTVDNAAESPSPFAIYINMFMRENSAALNDFEMQFLINEMIFAENIRRGVLVVKIIEIGHR